MTRVLSIIHHPIFGGPHNRNMRLAPFLAEHGVTVTVLLPDEPGNCAERLRGAGIDVVQMPLKRVRATRNLLTHIRFVLGFWGEVKTIRRLIKRLEIDVVQLNGLVNTQGFFAARSAGVSVVWQILDTHTPMIARRLLSPFVARVADVIMCTGVRVSAEHPGLSRYPAKMINFFPAVDVGLFAPDVVCRIEVRKRFDFSDASLVIGTVGNINKQKGHDNFIRAAAHFKKKVPGTKFVIFGATHENHKDYIDGLWSLASQLGLELGNDLFVVDPAGDVHELVQALDVFWMTPRPHSEGIPTAMEEAMSLSIPVVSFDVGSISELVEHGVSGYLVPDQNFEEVSNLTSEFLLNIKHRQSLGASGRRFVETHASIDVCAEKHLEAFRLSLLT